MARSHAEQVLSRFVAFGEQVGLGTDPERLLHRAVIEAFCCRLGGRAPTTKGTYRSRLRALTADRAPGPGLRFSGAAAAPPYTPADRAELFARAHAQRPLEKAASALVLLCAGLGAGLRPAELAELAASSLESAGGHVVVKVGGARARCVPVAAPYDAVLSATAASAGGGFLFRPSAAKRQAKNLANDFCAGLVADPAAVRLSLARCRASFICDHLDAATPLSAICRLAGILEVESLLRYARHVPSAPQSKAQLRARAQSERRG